MGKSNQSTQLLNYILNEIREAVYVRDLEQRFVYANHAFGRMIGLSPEQIIGKHLSQIFDAPTSQFYATIDNSVIAKGIIHKELVTQSLNGNSPSYTLNSDLFRGNDDKPSGVFGMYTSIDQSKSEPIEWKPTGDPSHPADIQKQALQAQTLTSLSHAYAKAGLDGDQVKATIAQRTAEAFGGACVIRLYSENDQALIPASWYLARAGVEKTPTTVSDFGIPGDLPTTYQKAWQAGEIIAIDDVNSETIQQELPIGYLPFLDQQSFDKLVAIPLRAQGRLIGILSLLGSGANEIFSSFETSSFQTLSDQASLAIENARLYSVQTLRAREMDALHLATTALLKTIELEALLSQILDAAQSAIPAAEQGWLHLVAPDTGELQIRAVTGYSDPRIRKIHFPTRRDYPAQAMRERKPILILDTQTEPGIITTHDAEEMRLVRSVIVAPLIFGQDVLGTISICSLQSHAFTESDLRLLVSFAATTTAALQNALLHSEVQRLAITDALTGQYNRRGLFELGKREIERFHRFQRPLTAIMLDIDHFKLVNDTFGHNTGDQVLKALTLRIARSIREVDIFGRYGGDEFVVLLPETDLFTASNVAERLRQIVMDSPLPTQDVPVVVTISLGLAKASHETLDLTSLLDRADTALYQAKQKGRNQVVVG